MRADSVVPIIQPSSLSLLSKHLGSKKHGEGGEEGE